MSRKSVVSNHTIYSPDYTLDKGECWDFRKLRGAKQKARSFGPGSLIIRNFENRNRAGDWWQSDTCLLWDGIRFRKAVPNIEERWVVNGARWRNASVVSRLRRQV